MDKLEFLQRNLMKVFDWIQIYQNMFLRRVIGFLPLRGEEKG
jgi:hypothetical protein